MIEGIVERIKTSLESSDYDSVIVFGPDNVQYLTGAHLPFTYSYPERFMAVFWPRKAEPTCVCPAEWEPSLSELSWMKGTRRYIEEPGNPGAILEPLSELVRATRRTTGKIGLDMDRVSAGLLDSLQDAISGFELVACDSWLRELRMTKTPGEVDLLEDVAYRTDHGIFGAAHHVLVTSARSEMSLSEEIRVHSMEMELDVVGHHSVSQTASGEHAKKFWPLAPKFGLGYAKHLTPGEYVRMEMRASLDGYWSNAARMITMGEPTEAQPEAYEALQGACSRSEETRIEIVRVPALYPEGGERQLIQVLTGLEVPAEGLPADIGYLCHNVGTAASVARAVLHGEPLISRIVTVTGSSKSMPLGPRS